MTLRLPGLPDGWAWTTVTDIGATAEQAVLTGPFGTSLSPDDFVTNAAAAVPILTIGCLREFGIDLSRANFVTTAKAQELERYRLRAGDILFSRMATVGRAGLVTKAHEGALFNYHLMRLRLRKDAVDPLFFVYYVRSSEVVRTYVKSANHGMTRDGINTEQLLSLPLPLAPRAHQQRIVEAIEDIASRLDSAVAALRRVQAKLKAYRASVLNAAVEGRLVPTEAELARKEGRSYEPADVLIARIVEERRRHRQDIELARMKAAGKTPSNARWKARYQEPATPDADAFANLRLPKGWHRACLGQLGNVGTGATPTRGEERYWRRGAVPWVTSAVVNAEVVKEASEYVTEAALAETNLSVYPPGTLLIAMYGEGKTRGRCAELGVPAATNQALAALVLGGSAQPMRSWIKLFMEHNYENIRDRSAGGVQPNLNLSIVRSLTIPVPPQGEQERIVNRVAELLSSEAHVQRELRATIRRLDRLRKCTLKAAFEGKLVDQNPADEPADVLLARIRAERAAAAPVKPKPKRQGTQRLRTAS